MDTGRFELFGTSHLAMLALFIAGIAPVVLLGRRVRGTDRETVVNRSWALAIPAVTIPLQLVDLRPGDFDVDTSLPLQLCDFAWIAAVITLWTRNHTASCLTFFWGLVLSSQGLITPALASDFPHPKFIAFWGMHLLIVWAAIHLAWGLGFRPSWRGYRSTVLLTLVWLVGVFAFNSVAETNYGFVSEKPATGSVLDHFGPWPTYVLIEIAIVAVVWALMTWPFTRAAHRQPASPSGLVGGAL